MNHLKMAIDANVRIHMLDAAATMLEEMPGGCDNNSVLKVISICKKEMQSQLKIYDKHCAALADRATHPACSTAAKGDKAC